MLAPSCHRFRPRPPPPPTGPREERLLATEAEAGDVPLAGKAEEEPERIAADRAKRPGPHRDRTLSPAAMTFAATGGLSCDVATTEEGDAMPEKLHITEIGRVAV